VDISGDNDADLEVGETWSYTAQHTVTQAEIDNNGGGDGDIDNTAYADSAQTDPDSDSEEVPVVQDPSLNIVKSLSAGSPADYAAGATINYTITVQNTGNQTLTNVTVSDQVEAYGSTLPLRGTDLIGNNDSNLDVGETWSYSSSYLVTQADIDNAGGGNGLIDNVATADSNQTGPDTDDAEAQLVIPAGPDIDVEKYVSVDGGTSWQDADSPTGPVLLSGSGNPMFKFVVTNNGGLTLNNVTLSDTDFDLNGAAAGTSLSLGTLAPGHTAADVIVTGTFATGQHTNTATVVGTSVLGVQATDFDDANYLGFSPITITGSPQFNFPNDLEKIQPKLQGADAFIINPLGYISWDLYTPNTTLARIDTNANFLSAYSGLTVSIVEIWNSGTAIGATGSQAIYRVYVANEGTTSVALANNTNIVEYDIVATSTNKGLVDLINSDPLIGNFNSFSNIENAVGKASNGFLTGNSPATNGNDNVVWSSTNVNGTGTGEALNPANPINGGAGEDALYGRNNATATTEQLNGDAGNDMIEARDGGDVVHGNDGNDVLFGSLGSDQLFGDAGADTLFGGYGADQLTGGTGNDKFIVRKGDFDSIMDFEAGDQIVVWADNLGGAPSQGSHTAVYDEDSGVLFVDDIPVAQLIGNPDADLVTPALVWG
jgi:large repetitive protein